VVVRTTGYNQDGKPVSLALDDSLTTTDPKKAATPSNSVTMKSAYLSGSRNLGQQLKTFPS
jgi:hypothetical protein